MEDWTDIIGEELEKIEESLPADDWSVLQQKYAAAQKRKKAAAYTWTGGITSVAAAIALVLLLTRPDSSNIIDDNNLVADNIPSPEITVPVDTAVVESDNVLPDVSIVVQKSVDKVLVAENLTEEASPVEQEEVFDVIRDTTSTTETLLADSSSNADEFMEMKECGRPAGAFGFEDFPEEPKRRVRRPMSIGLSGAVSDSPIIKYYDSAEHPMVGEPPYENDNLPEISNPGDSSFVDNTQPAKAMMQRAKSTYSDKYNHQIPVSIGISARFFLTDRLSINTGLNYTRYKSLRTRTFSGTYDGQKDWQYVHYLGIPVRLDWMAVNRKYVNFYLGAGVQMDKCVYATVGDERLHEKQVLFGLNGAVGIQVNIIPQVGIYLEPDVSYALNEGSIETFRSAEPFTIAVRAGLRFNF